MMARLRVPLGFIFGVVAFALAQPTRRSLAAGVAIACCGETIRMWAAGHLNKSREVTRSGPYRFAAHPLYLGSSVMGIGLAIAANNASVVAIVALYLVVTVTAAVRSEEAFLREKFGREYERYRRAGDSEKAFDGERTPDVRRFSLAQALANREHRALLGLVVVVLLLFLKATYNGVF
jgi:hypothetical protein